ncbi:transposable element Tc3 transposase [Trichonephila clavipes]|nr:transposable element Tc3 transposase [Trichonephila clavipes]
MRFRDKILHQYVGSTVAIIGHKFILMDDNAGHQRAVLVEDYFEDHGLDRMEWIAQSSDQNLIEHICDYLCKPFATLNPPPRLLYEL